MPNKGESYNVPVAQLDRVSDSDSDGCRFKSCQAHHFKTIAGLQSSLFVCAFRATNGCKNSNATLVAMRCFLFYNYLKTN